MEAKLQGAIRTALTSNYDDLSSLIAAASPLSVGQKLVAAGIVTESAFSQIQYLDPPTFAARLLGCAKPVLEYDDKKFHKFLSILFSFEPCVKVASKICNRMQEEGFPEYIPPISSTGQGQVPYSFIDQDSVDAKTFTGQLQNRPGNVSDPSKLSMEKAVRKVLCCCGNCNIDNFLARGCPNSERKLRKFPILDLSQLSNLQKTKLIARLLDESDRVVDEFASLISATQCALQKWVAVRELVVYLCALKLSRFHASLVNKQILKSLEEKLCACSDVSEVFLTLKDVWSWFNHSLLGKLIAQFKAVVGSDIQRRYDQYLANFLNPYLQQSIFEVPSDSYGPSSIIGYEEFILKVDDSVNDSVKVDMLSRMKLHAAKALGIEPEALALQSIDEGCFQVTFLIPSAAMDIVFPLSPTCVRAFSQFELEIGGIMYRGTVTRIHRTQESKKEEDKQVEKVQVVPKIQTETEGIFYEFCDQESQDDRSLSVEERTRFHDSASECIRNSMGATNYSTKGVPSVLQMFVKRVESEFFQNSALGEDIKQLIMGRNGPDIDQAKAHFQQVIEYLFRDGQVNLGRIAACFAYAYCIFRVFVQSIMETNVLVHTLTTIASWLIASFVHVRLSRILQQAGSWATLVSGYMPSWLQANGNILLVLGLVFLGAWAVRKYVLD